jgi:hypothetical protein
MDDDSLLEAIRFLVVGLGDPVSQILIVPALKPDRRLARIKTTGGGRYVAKMFNGVTDRYMRERDCRKCLPATIAPGLFHADDHIGLLVTEEFSGRQLQDNSAAVDYG